MAGSSWTNQVQNLLIIAGTGGQTIGVFVYSAAPAANTLAISIVPGGASVTDPFGNIALSGVTTYLYEPGIPLALAMQWSGLTWTVYSGESMTSGWLSSLEAFSIEADTSGGDLTSLTIATAGTLTAMQPGTTTPETWHDIVLDSGWSDVSGYAVPQYRLLPEGNLQFAGIANAGSSQTSAKALNSSNPLPSAYRPTSTKYVSQGGTNRGAVQLAPSGVLTMETSASFPGQYAEIENTVSLL